MRTPAPPKTSLKFLVYRVYYFMWCLVNEFLLPYSERLKVHESAAEKAGGWFAESEENSMDANRRNDSVFSGT